MKGLQFVGIIWLSGVLSDDTKINELFFHDNCLKTNSGCFGEFTSANLTDVGQKFGPVTPDSKLIFL